MTTSSTDGARTLDVSTLPWPVTEIRDGGVSTFSIQDVVDWRGYKNSLDFGEDEQMAEAVAMAVNEHDTLLARARRAEAAERLCEKHSLRDTADMNIIAEQRDRATERAERAEDENRRLRETLQDFATYGVRHDLMPTRVSAGDPRADAEFWYNYLSSIDSHVRSAARTALGLEKPQASVVESGA